MTMKKIILFVSAALPIGAPTFAQNSPLPERQMLQKKVFYAYSEAIASPDSVYHLNLRQQDVADLTPAIARLRRLQYANMMKNRIEALPPEIGELGMLQTLLLRQNRLTTLPAEIGGL